MNYIIQHLHAPSDTNGNPRRLFYVLNVQDKTEKVYDEGYYGWSVLPNEVRVDSFQLPTLDITVKEYKGLIKEWGQ